MTIVIDPEFSVYQLLERIRRTSTMINHRRTMLEMSIEIENTMLMEKSKARVFSGFQRFSRFVPQIERYTALAKQAEHIYIFGEADITPPTIANLTYVPLKAGDQLLKEWFVLVYGPEFFSLLATRELTHIDDPDSHRVFEGIWSFDFDLTDIIQEWLTSTVDAPPLSFSDLHAQRKVQILKATIGRLAANLNNAPDSAVDLEISTTIETVLKPKLAELETQI